MWTFSFWGFLLSLSSGSFFRVCLGRSGTHSGRGMGGVLLLDILFWGSISYVTSARKVQSIFTIKVQVQVKSVSFEGRTQDPERRP